MTEPRVLMLTGEYPPMTGGIADYTSRLVRALEPIGVEVDVLSRSGTEAGATVEAWNWGLTRTTRNLVRTQRFNLVHIQYQAGAFDMHPVVNLLPLLLRDTPVVTTFHDLRPPYLFPKAGRLRYHIMRRMARWSSGVIVTNPADARTMARSSIEHCLIPLGPSLPRPASAPRVEQVVGYFGFPSKQKGFDALVQAIGEIPADQRPVLKIIGGEPPVGGAHGFLSRKDVERIAQEAGVCVQWTGYLAPVEASAALATCGVIAFPFPLGATQRSSALIAALQTGRPVVTTSPADASDLGELTRLGQLRVIPRGNLDALKIALIDALSAPGATDPLPNAYAWESIARSHADLYRSILEASSR